MRGIKFVEVIDGQVIRHHIDQVGNNLTARLMWCETHVEPVWMHSDHSCPCPQTTVVQWDTKDHVIVPLPFFAIERDEL